MSFESTATIPDPNDIPPSPSPSAWQPLPNQTPSAPSAVSSGSRTPDTIPARPPSVPLPPLDLIPDMPDNQSRTTRVRSPEHHNAIPVQVFRNGSSKRVLSPKRALSPPVDVDKPLPPPPPTIRTSLFGSSIHRHHCTHGAPAEETVQVIYPCDFESCKFEIQHGHEEFQAERH